MNKHQFRAAVRGSAVGFDVCVRTASGRECGKSATAKVHQLPRRSILVDFLTPATQGLVQQEVLRVPLGRKAGEVICQRLGMKASKIIRVRRWSV